MSPKKRKKLNILRKNLDKLDNSFIKLVKKRSAIVEKVLELKNHKNQIVDKKRIRIIFKNLRKKSLKRKIDSDITKSIWKTMIRSFIKYEYKNFKKK